MRIVKVFSLVALTAVAALTVGASSASATFKTQLCKSDESLTCSDPATSTHLVLREGAVGKLLSPLITILCLSNLVNASLLELGKPQKGHVELSLSSCGTNAAHDNCTLTTEEQPTGYLLKTGKGEGVLVGENGVLRVQCPNIAIDCRYTPAGVEIPVEDPGLGAANEVPVESVGEKFFCPDEPTLDAAMESLENVYIRS